MEDIRIHAPGLLLRNLDPADLDDVIAYRCDPAVFRYIGAPMTPRSAADHIGRYADGWSRCDGESLYLAVEECRRRAVIGEVMLRDLDTRHRRAEFGIALARTAQGLGHGLYALGGLLRYAFETVGLHRLVAYHDVDNPQAAAVARRLGLTCEGRLRHNVLRAQEWRDEFVMSMLAGEWPAVRGRLTGAPTGRPP